MCGPGRADCVAILTGDGALVTVVPRKADARPNDLELLEDCTDWAPFGIGCKKTAGESIEGGGRA